MRRFLCLSCSASLVTATAGLVQSAAGQDRVDQITQSAAEIQSSESYGQPYERGQNYSQGGYQYGQRPAMQGRYQQGYTSQNEGGESGGQWDQYGDQFNRQSSRQGFGRGDSPAGLGVVLQETGDQGVQVIDVHPGSPAEEAGLRPGDQIVAINGRRTDRVQELQSRVMQQNPGERVEVAILRDGRQQTFEARLEARGQALNRQQQARFPSGGQSQQGSSPDPQIQSRLASLERQLQQLLREVRNLQDSMGSQVSQADYTDAPQPPRQAQREDERFWQDGGQQWDQQQQRRLRSDQTFDDSGRRSQDQFDF